MSIFCKLLALSLMCRGVYGQAHWGSGNSPLKIQAKKAVILDTLWHLSVTQRNSSYLLSTGSGVLSKTLISVDNKMDNCVDYFKV